jgi:3-deoxy-D-manno-octulosonate 8-phosphate phosphatase KdsC-like HAD superfamily phosphatase
MDEGEYTYKLLNDDVVLAQGLLQIGDYQNNAKKYTVTDDNGIKQYNG